LKERAVDIHTELFEAGIKEIKMGGGSIGDHQAVLIFWREENICIK